MGFAIGAALFPSDPGAVVVCMAAGALPDLTMVPQYRIDMGRDIQPMTNQSRSTDIAKNIGHSTPLWLLVVITAILLPHPLIIAFAAGGFVHVVVDILTHAGMEYRATEATFLWPLPRKYNLNWLGIWEYRYGHGILYPKPFEFAVLVFCLIAGVLLVTLAT